MLITLLSCAEEISPNDDVDLDPIGQEDPIDDPGDEPGEDPGPAGVPAGDLDDPVVPVDDEPAWDGSAPDGPAGMEVAAVVSCTLFREPVEVTFVKTNDPWLWDVEVGPEGSFRVPELAPCYPQVGGSMPVMLWDPEPRITILSDGMVHTLDQTMRADFWEGGALPMEGSSYECDEALAQLGLAWPLPLTMTVLGPVEAEDAE
jgi:hypothetical protein